MPRLRSNLVKRVQRLPKPRTASEALQPLFEAISNAIHSVQARFGENVTRRGKVMVTVALKRSKDRVSVDVEDNGIGLDAENWNAFLTTDTDNKISIGGKGVGRLLWLDCFNDIQISSVYENAGRRRRRSFSFVLHTEDQIQNYRERAATSSKVGTGFHISFSGLKNNGYRDKFPGRASYVHQHFTSHFLPTLIGGASPEITLVVGEDVREYPEAISKWSCGVIRR